jgi:hypothetical protein
VITLYLVVGRKNDPDLDERQERAMDFESTTMTPVEQLLGLQGSDGSSNVIMHVAESSVAAEQ